MKHKIVSGSLEASGEGFATAIFSRFGGPPDRDGDITERSAFVDGTVVAVSPWNHTSLADALPAGRGIIRVYPDRAECEVEFFMRTQAGRETYETLKALGRCQWSYGFKVLKSRAGRWQDRPVQILEKLDVFEVSPVLRGAGRDTATVSVRTAPDLAAIRHSVLGDPDAARREYARFVLSRNLGGS